jgi:hypothetical protein
MNSKTLDKKTVGALELFAMEFGFKFIGLYGDIGHFTSENIILAKMPVCHCKSRLRDVGYEIE